MEVADLLRALERNQQGLYLPAEVTESWTSAIDEQTSASALYNLTRDLGALGGYLYKLGRSANAVEQLILLTQHAAERFLALEAHRREGERPKARSRLAPMRQESTPGGAFRAPEGIGPRLRSKGG